jgi:OHCU decarboxylase
MRAHPAEYELVSPRTLPGVLSLLASEPGAWLPIAGGTDVMVQYSAGTLPARKLVSIWNLPELRRIETSADEIRIGAGCTYTDLREHQAINTEFPLLSSAASWTGGIANQNRGTLGGNIVNASPAADSLPALLVYDAELLLVSARGERRAPYPGFHTSYRKTQLAPDELIRAVCLKKQFSGYYAHARKVGARNAQAISKVCLAALGRLAEGVVEDIRLAMGSVAPVPLRLTATERILRGKRIDLQLIQLAKMTAAAEVQPIDDIRSSARYRAAVAGNLVAEFLEQLTASHARGEKAAKTLARWNSLPPEKAAAEVLPCCGSKAWAREMATRRPILDEAALLTACDEVCKNLPEADWLDAFRSHPRIGDSHAPASAPSRSAEWSGEEQRKVGAAADKIKAALAAGNRAYEEKFNRIFIVCATGKSVPTILSILERRLQNDEATELLEAAEQQRQIAHLRLKKWLLS